MRISIELSEEEVRQAIVDRLHKETSKHGHVSSHNQQISWSQQGKSWPLAELQISIQAQIDTKVDA